MLFRFYRRSSYDLHFCHTSIFILHINSKLTRKLKLVLVFKLLMPILTFFKATLLKNKDYDIKSVEDGENLLRALSSCEKEMENISKRMDQQKREGIEVTDRHPCLHEDVDQLQLSLLHDFKHVKNLITTKKHSVNESLQTKQFLNLYDEIEIKAEEMVFIFFTYDLFDI